MRKFSCTKESFVPRDSKGVRWLAPNADFYRFQQALRTGGYECPSFEEWTEWYAYGIVMCGYMEKGILRAFAGVIKKDAPDWALGDVLTLELFRKRGFATATISFVTAYILNNRAEATCSFESASPDMEKVLTKLGYIEVFEKGAETLN